MGASALALSLSSAAFDGAVIVAGDPAYDGARRIWNGLADRRPAAIVRARSTADVARAIEAAAENDVRLAVRCGGHSLPGLSTCDDGIVLDMSLMNRTVVDPAARIAEVSGGALLGDLDRAGEPHGLVVPAGVVSHTGAAGLTLGGGMGWLSRRYGLTIDNLLGIEMVTADGREIHASAAHEPELFWGLRGGGGNFGVVTKFIFRMQPLGPVAAGKWLYPPKLDAATLRRFHDLSSTAARSLTTQFNLTADGLSVTAFWSGEPAEANSALSPFGRLAPGGEGDCGAIRFVNLQSRSDEHMRWGRRFYAKGGFFGDLSDDIISRLLEAMATLPTPDSDIYLIQLGGAVSDVAEDATAYTGRAASYYWIVSPVWDDPAADGRCMAWGRSVAAQLAALSLTGNYVNEQADTGVAAVAYGPEKYARLQKLKTRFDPRNVFRLNQNIEPHAA